MKFLKQKVASNGTPHPDADDDPVFVESSGADRLQEIEDLLLLVEIENTKIREQISQGYSGSSTAVPEDIKLRLERLEDSLSSRPASSQTGEAPLNDAGLDDIRKELDELKDGISAPVDTSHIDSRLSSIEESVANLEQKIKSGSGAVAGNFEKELRAKLDEIAAISDEYKRLSEKSSSLSNKLEKLELGAEKADVFVSKMKMLQDMDKHLENRIEAGIESAAESRFGKKFAEFERSLARIEQLKSSLEDEASTRISYSKSMQDIEDRLKKFKSFEKKDVDAVESGIRKQASDIAEMRKAVEDSVALSSAAEKKVQSLDASLSLFRKSSEHRFVDSKYFTEELGSLKKQLSAAAGASRSSDSLAKDIGSIRNEFENSLSSVRKELQSLSASTQSQLASHMDYAEKYLNKDGKELEQLKSAFSAKVSQATAGLEQEAALARQKIDDNVRHLQSLVKKNDLSSIHKELEENRRQMNEMKTDVEMAALKVITREIGEFSKAVDQKIPDFVSRHQYAQDMEELRATMRVIEAPDLSRLENDMKDLEEKVSDVYAILRSMSGRLPVVVE